MTVKSNDQTVNILNILYLDRTIIERNED